MAIESHQDLRAGVRDLCRTFPDAYWRDLDARRAYPDEFVQALTRAGYLAALIPEEFGGSGLSIDEAAVILEEINRSGSNSGACHAQMYTMGTLLRHGSDAQKRKYLPAIASGELRLQAFGVSEPTTTSFAVRRSGSRAPNTRTCFYSSSVRLRLPRSRNAPTACRFCWSMCVTPSARV
jgi:acyl-CoA dehydrogenase